MPETDGTGWPVRLSKPVSCDLLVSSARHARCVAGASEASQAAHDAPHVPHAWECGFLMEETTRTLLCGDLFTQGGSKTPALTESAVLVPSEEFRNEEAGPRAGFFEAEQYAAVARPLRADLQVAHDLTYPSDWRPIAPGHNLGHTRGDAQEMASFAS